MHGWFFYRYRGGESPADCYDRVGQWLSSLQREVVRTGAEQVVVLSHGLTLRCLLMRWLRLSVEQFDALDNPRHCGAIELLRGQGRGDEVGEQLMRGKASNWSVRGLQLREQWKDWREEEYTQPTATRAATQQRSDDTTQ